MDRMNRRAIPRRTRSTLLAAVAVGVFVVAADGRPISAQSPPEASSLSTAVAINHSRLVKVSAQPTGMVDGKPAPDMDLDLTSFSATTFRYDPNDVNQVTGWFDDPRAAFGGFDAGSSDFYVQTAVTVLTMGIDRALDQTTGEIAEWAFNWRWTGLPEVPPREDFGGDPALSATNVHSSVRIGTEHVSQYSQWNGDAFDSYQSPLISGEYRTPDTYYRFVVIPGLPSAAWANVSWAAEFDPNSIAVQVSEQQTPNEVVDLSDPAIDGAAAWTTFSEALVDDTPSTPGADEPTAEPTQQADPQQGDPVRDDASQEASPQEDPQVESDAQTLPEGGDVSAGNGGGSDDVQSGPSSDLEDDAIEQAGTVELEPNDSELADPAIAEPGGSGTGWVWVIVPIVVAGTIVGWRLSWSRSRRRAAATTDVEPHVASPHEDLGDPNRTSIVTSTKQDRMRDMQAAEIISKSIDAGQPVVDGRVRPTIDAVMSTWNHAAKWPVAVDRDPANVRRLEQWLARQEAHYDVGIGELTLEQTFFDADGTPMIEIDVETLRFRLTDSGARLASEHHARVRYSQMRSMHGEAGADSPVDDPDIGLTEPKPLWTTDESVNL
jgi:hypothetical protein